MKGLNIMMLMLCSNREFVLENIKTEMKREVYTGIGAMSNTFSPGMLFTGVAFLVIIWHVFRLTQLFINQLV